MKEDLMFTLGRQVKYAVPHRLAYLLVSISVALVLLSTVACTEPANPLTFLR